MHGSRTPELSAASYEDHLVWGRSQQFAQTLLVSIREQLRRLEESSASLRTRELHFTEQYRVLYGPEPEVISPQMTPRAMSPRPPTTSAPSAPSAPSATPSPVPMLANRQKSATFDDRLPIAHPRMSYEDDKRLSRRFSKTLSVASSHRSSHQGGFNKAESINTSMSLGVELAGVWVEGPPSRKTFSKAATRGATQGFTLNSRTLRSISNLSESWDFVVFEVMSFHPWRVLHPSSWKRVLLDVVGIIFILFDAVITPLRAFDLESSPFFETSCLVAACYWVVELIASCVTGYRKEGVVETRLWRVLQNYAITWLVPDLVLLSLDVVYFLKNDWQATWSFGAVGGWLGLARLLRLGKLPYMLRRVLERAQSDLALILIQIVELMVFILFATHVIACVWFQIGTLGHLRDDNESSWVREYELDSRGILYRYTTSLHWSVTQFTPASMEVSPTNPGERVFTVAVVIFALLCFSSIVSSITNATTRLRHRDKERLDEYAVLRRFLAERGVRADLVGGIWGHIHRVWSRSQRRMHVSEVKILELLPRSLHSDLQHEVFAPTFAPHPFFQQFAKCHELGMRRLYQTAITEESLSTGMELFTTGDPSFYMYLASYGEFDYSVAKDLDSVATPVRHSRRDQASRWKAETDYTGVAVCPGAWISEPSLWTMRWMHQGVLTAKKQSEVVAIGVERFQKMVKRDVVGRVEVTRYANEYIALLKQDNEATDLWGEPQIIETLARKAFGVSEASVRG